MYSSYIIARSASRMRCRMTCFAVCAAMRPKSSGVTSSRLIWSSGTSDQSMSRSSSEMSVCDARRSPPRAARAPRCARSRASSSSRSSMSSGSSIEKTRKSPFVVELDGGVPGRARRLLVGGEQRVLERRDQRALLDALLALDLADGLDDLLAHLNHPSSIRFPRTIASYGISTRSPFGVDRQRVGLGRNDRRRGIACGRRPRCEVRSATAGPRRSGSAPACAAGARGPARRRRPCTGPDSRAGGR